MKKYMVGGAVRDKLLGLEPKDVDYVVVGSTPEEMLALGFKQVGADFPVFLDEAGVEYALARTERKSGSGYTGFVTNHSPDVTLEQDLERRDLTINAMAMDDEGNLYDPYGGQEDLQNRVLRHVSDAFADDPVRVLRLARFRARYGSEWTVAVETLDFCNKLVESGELDALTRERVLKEFEKALSEPSPVMFAATLHTVGAYDVLFPEMPLSAWARLPTRTGSLGNAKFSYAELSRLMADPESFEKRLNVSSAWCAYATMYRHFSYSFYKDVHLVEALYKMDAFRRSDLFTEVMKDIDSVYAGQMFKAFELARAINFDSIPELVRNNLTGPAVANYIKKMRVKAYDASVTKQPV